MQRKKILCFAFIAFIYDMLTVLEFLFLGFSANLSFPLQFSLGHFTPSGQACQINQMPILAIVIVVAQMIGFFFHIKVCTIILAKKNS